MGKPEMSDKLGVQPVEQPLRIFVLDDDGFERQRLKTELSALGHEVVVESRAQSAVEILLRNPPDIAFLNPLLRGASWVRVLHTLRPAVHGSRWAIVTDAPSCSLIAEASRLGAYGVLAKPVTSTQLLNLCTNRPPPPTNETPEDLSLARHEWEHVNTVLRLCDGNMTLAARRLGIPRQSLYNKFRKAPATVR